MVTMNNKTFKINIPIWPLSTLNGGGENTNSTQVSARPTSSASVAMNAANAAGQSQISWPAVAVQRAVKPFADSLTLLPRQNWRNCCR
jgi:hypothetical protein